MLQSFGNWAVLCFCKPRAIIATLFRANRYIKTNYKKTVHRFVRSI